MSTPPPPQKKPKLKQYDFRDVVTATPRGVEMVTALDNGTLSIQQRKALTRILVSHLMIMHGDRPTAEEKVAFARALVDQFPSQKDSEGEGYEAWFCRGKGNQQATGYLEQRLRNVRKRSQLCVPRKLKEQSSKGNGKGNGEVLSESDVTDERAAQMKTWLKHNTSPKDQVESYMKSTARMRAAWIKTNPESTTMQIKAEFPRLFDTPGMIEQDFMVMYGQETSDSFLGNCELFSKKIYDYAETQGTTWKQQLGLQSSADFPDISLLAIQVLPCILPSGLVLNKNKKTVRASRAEALAAFIDAKPVGTNLPHYLDSLQQGRKKVQPFILVLGKRCSPSQVFVIVDGLAIEASTLLKGVDICFKSFYVLDVEYPKECQSTWEFIQKFFFKLGQGKGKTVTSPGVRSLRTFIEKPDPSST